MLRTTILTGKRGTIDITFETNPAEKRVCRIVGTEEFIAELVTPDGELNVKGRELEFTIDDNTKIALVAPDDHTIEEKQLFTGESEEDAGTYDSEGEWQDFNNYITSKARIQDEWLDRLNNDHLSSEEEEHTEIEDLDEDAFTALDQCNHCNVETMNDKITWRDWLREEGPYVDPDTFSDKVLDIITNYVAVFAIHMPGSGRVVMNVRIGNNTEEPNNRIRVWDDQQFQVIKCCNTWPFCDHLSHIEGNLYDQLLVITRCRRFLWRIIELYNWLTAALEREGFRSWVSTIPRTQFKGIENYDQRMLSAVANGKMCIQYTHLKNEALIMNNGLLRSETKFVCPICGTDSKYTGIKGIIFERLALRRVGNGEETPFCNTWGGATVLCVHCLSSNNVYLCDECTFEDNFEQPIYHAILPGPKIKSANSKI